jgi:predicted outer membrane repeat protein
VKRKIFSILFAVVLVVGCSLVLALPAAGATIYTVDDDWQVGTPPYDEDTDGDNDFATIQAAIDAASSGDTIYVAAGTYNENITLKDGVGVLGAGANVTTIDGGDSGTVVTANGVGSATILDGFTITHGSAENGGGMYNNGSSPTVIGCTFSGNSASDRGGGICNAHSSSPAVTGCTFFGNTASYGGGMWNAHYSSPAVTGCTFSGNTAANRGGGMYNLYDSSPAVTNCIISNNRAGSYGGGIYADGTSSPIIAYNDVWNNTPNNYYGCSAGTNDISEDPLFVDPGAGDYHLRPGSPCVDAGNNAAVPAWLTTDFEGDPRIVYGDTIAVVDMGADEYVPPNTLPNAPVSPLCEEVTNPTGVTDPSPEFSWTFSDPDGGDTQGAYQILVASTSGNLASDNGDIWDSGKVDSSVSQVSYAGTTLAANQTYYWKAKTWDNNDAEGPYCSQQQFITLGEAPAQGASPEAKSPVSWPLVGGIIAAVVVVGLGVFFVIRRRIRRSLYLWLR